MKTQTENSTKHTPGPLIAMSGALLCKDVNQYGNWIIADCNRERTPEDDANIERLAMCWNEHDQLIAQRDALREALKEIAERGPVEGHGRRIEMRLRLVGTQSIARAALAMCEPKDKE